MTTQSLDDLLSGELAPVAAVAKNRTGKRPSGPTVWRWCKRGVRGGTIRLMAVCHSGQWLTTASAFNAFLKQQTEAAFSDSAADLPDDDAALQTAGLL